MSSACLETTGIASTGVSLTAAGSNVSCLTRNLSETNKDAPNGKIVYTDVDFSTAKSVGHVSELTDSLPLHDLVPEQKDGTLDDCGIFAGDKLLVTYTRDVKSELWHHELKTGKQVRRLLPDFVGTIAGISGDRDYDDVFVSTTSLISPTSTYRLTWSKSSSPDAEPKTKLWLATKLKTINPEDFVSEQIFFNSTDGTKIPMFVTRLKSTPLDGTAPAWVYAYGGFNISLQPSFAPSMITWVAEYGGVLIWLNARGGGEYGQTVSFYACIRSPLSDEIASVARCGSAIQQEEHVRRCFVLQPVPCG